MVGYGGFFTIIRGDRKINARKKGYRTHREAPTPASNNDGHTEPMRIKKKRLERDEYGWPLVYSNLAKACTEDQQALLDAVLCEAVAQGRINDRPNLRAIKAVLAEADILFDPIEGQILFNVQAREPQPEQPEVLQGVLVHPSPVRYAIGKAFRRGRDNVGSFMQSSLATSQKVWRRVSEHVRESEVYVEDTAWGRIILKSVVGVGMVVVVAGHVITLVARKVTLTMLGVLVSLCRAGYDSAKAATEAVVNFAKQHKLTWNQTPASAPVTAAV